MAQRLLILFDFDGTIINGHTHNTIVKAIRGGKAEQNDINSQWDVVKNFAFIGSSNQLKNIFERLIKQGHCVYIVSFNDYGSIILRFLKKMGLPDDARSKIKIIAKFPENPREANKNEYIEQAISEAKKDRGFSGQPAEVILIDDSTKNCEAAEKQGYSIIQADKHGKHLTQLNEMIFLKYIVIFDFDETIIAGHTHNIIAKAENARIKETKKTHPLPLKLKKSEKINLIKGLPVVGDNPEKWKSCIEGLLEEKCQPVIISFTRFPEVIQEYLIETIKLSKEVCNKIIIKTQNPPKPSEQDKTLLVEQVLNEIKVEKAFNPSKAFDPSHVLVVDDKKSHVDNASNKGYTALLAKSDASHLNEIQTTLNVLLYAKQKEQGTLSKKKVHFDENLKGSGAKGCMGQSILRAPSAFFPSRWDGNPQKMVSVKVVNELLVPATRYNR